MQILSIFLKLQAVKQSGPGFFGLPGRYITAASDNTHMLWHIDVKELHCVQVGGVEPTTRTIQHLQPLSFLNCQINHDWSVWQTGKCLHKHTSIKTYTISFRSPALCFHGNHMSGMGNYYYYYYYYYYGKVMFAHS